MATLLNASPLSERDGTTLQIGDFACKLKGMNGDHASDQLKMARLSQRWKEEVTRTDLGNTAINSMSLGALSTALVPHMSESNSESSNVSEALGNAIKALAMELGTAAFEGLPADEQH